MLNENIEMYYSHCINPSRGYITERTFYIDSEVFNGEKKYKLRDVYSNDLDNFYIIVID